MQELLVIIGYLLLFTLLIWNLNFFSLKSVNKVSLVAIFILKVVFGLFFGVLHYTHYGFVDTFQYFRIGEAVFQTIHVNPLHFLELVFLPNNRVFPEHLEYIRPHIGYWSNTSSYTIVRFNALAYFISFGYFNVHTVFVSFLSFTGLVMIYKVFSSFYEGLKQKLLIIAFFLIPSVLFYGSGIHKEAFAILAIGMILYHFHKLTDTEFTYQRVLYVLAGLTLLFLVRNFLAVAIIPCLAGYYIVKKFPAHALLKFSGVTLLFWLLALNVHVFIPKANIPEIISIKQSQFKQHSGEHLPIGDLEGNMWSMIRHSPTATFNVMVHPLPGTVKNIYQFFYLIEVWLVLAVLLLSILFYTKGVLRYAPLLYFSFWFSAPALIIIGLTATNLGAISRYKTPCLLFLVIFLLMVIDYTKISRMIWPAKAEKSRVRVES